jgi:ATP-dependent Clp protease adaptor protein ClpS
MLPLLAAPSDGAGRLALPLADPLSETVGETDQDAWTAPQRAWVTVVWNDPVNLMSYVVYIFQKLLGMDKRKATELMLKVHHEGRAVVTSGSRERMEGDASRLHAAGLWATVQPEA